MRVWLAIIGILLMVGVGVAVVGPSGPTEAERAARAADGPSSVDRVRLASRRAGRDNVLGDMTASTTGRSMFGSSQGTLGSRSRSSRDVASSSSSSTDTITTGDTRDRAREGRARPAQTKPEITNTDTRAEAYRERQKRLAQEAMERRAQRLANADRNIPPRNNAANPSVRNRVQQMQQLQNNQVTGGRQAVGRQTGGIRSPSAAAAAAAATQSTDASDGSSGKSGGMDPALQQQLLQQLLSKSGSKGNTTSSGSGSGAFGGSSGNASGSGSGGGTTTSSGAGGGPTTITGAGTIVASPSGFINANLRWIPVDSASCSDLTGYRTNDLYLRLDGPDRLVAVDSGQASTGIQITGAGFRQDPDGTDQPSTSGCTAFDTFLDFGGASFAVLTGGGAKFPTSSGTVVATWVSLTGVAGAQNSARFGDQGWYIRLGRFTASNAVTRVSGQILAQLIPAEGSSPESLVLPLPDCDSCWGGSVLPPSTGNGGTDNGGTDNGGTDNGGTDNGGTDDGGTDNGGTDNGGTDDGGTDNGGTDDGGTDDGGTDDGGTDNGGTDDGGTDNGGTDDGGTDDGGTDDDLPEGVEAVWLSINNNCDPTGFDGCVAPTGFGTYDLYLRMGAPHRFTILDLGESTTGLLFGSSQVFQNGGNAPLKPRPPSLPPRCPCLEFDSFFDFGGGSFAFFTEPNPDAWLTPLSAVWYAELGTVVTAAQKPTLFNDGAYYLRVMRLTIEPSAIVSGRLLALGTESGTGKSLAVEVEIPDLP